MRVLILAKEEHILDKYVNVLTQDLDNKKYKRMYKARNCFHGRVGVGTLKRALGYNHYGK